MSAPLQASSRQALLDLVENDRRERCAALATQSAAEVAALMREARRVAHARLGEALAAERRRLRERLEALDARLATEQRLVAQRQLRERLDIAWRELPRALEARWAQAGTRAQWARAALEQSEMRLGRDAWRIVHAPGLTEGERAELRAWLAARGVSAARFDEDATLDAGLRVQEGANSVDATLRGLLSDRAALGARLSAALLPAERAP